MNMRFLNILASAIIFLAASSAPTLAATFTVTNTNDSGAGSLRQAILDANAASGADTIVFDPSFNVPRTITMASDEMLISSLGGDLTINGPGMNLLTVSGNDQFRVFQINSADAAINVAINNLTITRARLTSAGQGAGASIAINNGGAANFTAFLTLNNVAITRAVGNYNINCNDNCDLTVNNSYIGNNSNAPISINDFLSDDNLVINNSTIENNVSGADGLINVGGHSVTVTNSTISDNVVGNNGIFRISLDPNDTFDMTNTTITRNRGGLGAAIGLSGGGTTSIANLTNVTIANNYSGSPNTSAGITSGTGFAIWNIKNSIIANNFNSAGNADFYLNSINHQLNISYSLVESIFVPTSGTQSHPVPATNGNLPGVDPWLDGDIFNYGGTTKTLALRRGSPAIDAGDPTTFPSTDQRGISRPQDGDGTGGARSDMGAFERRPNEASSTDKADFDGDGKTDLSIFRPAPGEWWYMRSSNGSGVAAQFGTSSDKIVPSDYTGDGKADFAIFRPSAGQWFVLRSEDFSFYAFPLGLGSDTPVPADYDGDSRTDAAVYRASTNTWYIARSSGGMDIVGFGAAGDKPVVSDYDSDGKADIAIFRPGGINGAEWWIRRSSDASVFAVQFGTSTDKPVQGDYTGDGKADVAIFRPSNGNWFILRSEDLSFFSFPFGASTDTPVPGDYDGDGRQDAAVFRPSSSTWFILGSTGGTLIQNFGAPGDQPVPSAYILP